MVLRSAPDPHPHLTVLRGRKPDRRTAAEEGRIEVVAFIDEVILAMHSIVHAEVDRDIPSARVINEAGRIVVKAALARAEYLSLIGPEAA